MRAIVSDAPRPPEALHIRQLLVPEPVSEWMRIAVKAFGLNRSELHTRWVGSFSLPLSRLEPVQVIARRPSCRVNISVERTQSSA
jgi:hypothetical protein